MAGSAAASGAHGAPRGAARGAHRGDSGGAPGRGGEAAQLLFGALDLGTNNCRLLVATPTGDSFRVVDAFSRIVRLGEGLAETGEISDGAMDRAIGALRICASKLRRRQVTRMRCIATAACRDATNGARFLERVKTETGLTLEVITPEEEANLSVAGCMSLIDRASPVALVVDIGGGSTELSWVDVEELVRREAGGPVRRAPVIAWASVPVGVVTLAERFPEGADHVVAYDAMIAHVASLLPEPEAAARLRPAFDSGAAHIVGSSGTITSLASVHLELPRYDRNKVDGIWLTKADTEAACLRLKRLSRAERAAQPCIGTERADVVLAGCAILEAIAAAWPAQRMRVADRGLREGMLLSLMQKPRRKRRRGRRRRGRNGAPAGTGADG